MNPTAKARAPFIVMAVLALVGGLLASPPPATADSAPKPPETIRTVTADSLPTVQVDGVVWDQLIVGNTVYVTGSFRYARPAGARPGKSQVARAGALAYDLRTGKLITGWRPKLNGPGRVLAVSSDRSRIFIGGEFTKVNGVARSRLVAVSPATGAVIPGWRADANARVSALAVSGRTLYVGGSFTAVSGRARTRLAAVGTSTGALYRWAPRADAPVLALVVPKGVGNVVIGGRMATINGVLVRGMGAVDARTGRVRSWLANRVIVNYGLFAAITSLSTDGSGSRARVFGTGYTYRPDDIPKGYLPKNRFESTFRASATTGALTWVNGCRGDTYDAVPVGGVLYSVGHPHFCTMIGGAWGYGSEPKEDQRFQRVLATTTARDGVNTRHLMKGRPAPRLLHWYPTVNQGTVTGQNQGAWTIEANGSYVIIGGEFTEVNRRGQQGLARFAIRAVAPNREGPQGYDTLKPTVTVGSDGTVTVTWISSYDRDNRAMTHEVLRGRTKETSVVVATRTTNAAWWRQPRLTVSQTGLPPGSTQTFRIRAIDPLGNELVGPATSVKIPGTNQKPAASFTASAADLVVSVDGSASSDPEKQPLTHTWDFGDGATATGATASHTYAVGGTYTIRLTVTDPEGAAATTSRQVAVAAPNQPPVASYTWSATGLTAAFDGSTSSDPDGQPLSHLWSFGDGATATGPTASHLYAAPGTYSVVLTVTDARGAVASVTKAVAVTAPLPSTAPSPAGASVGPATAAEPSPSTG